MASGKDRIPFRVSPMLATLVRKPFHLPGWVYEEKYDGYRILAYKEGDRITLLSRNDNDRTATYASVARAVQQVAPRTLLLDGEVWHSIAMAFRVSSFCRRAGRRQRTPSSTACTSPGEICATNLSQLAAPPRNPRSTTPAA